MFQNHIFMMVIITAVKNKSSLSVALQKKDFGSSGLVRNLYPVLLKPQGE